MERQTWRPGPPAWRAAPAPRLEPPAGLADVGELGEPWARAAWHAAVAIASGWRGDGATWTRWGYPPPMAYRAVAEPRRPVVVPAPRSPRQEHATPRWIPTTPVGVAPA